MPQEFPPADTAGAIAWSCFAREQWQEALEAANNGLVLDSEHALCANIRALALIRLGRRSEAAGTLAATLARDPKDAVAHATKGWLLLEEERRDEAVLEFKAARRLDPSLDYARQGIVAALKARHSTYALFLRYLLWMGRIGGKARLLLILGLWGGMQILDKVAKDAPTAAPVIAVVGYLYFAFVLVTWLADPLFNLTLLGGTSGRAALSSDNRWSGITVGLNIAAGGALFIAEAFGLPHGSTWGFLVLIWVLPLAGIWVCPSGAPRTLMAVYSFALILNIALVWLVPDRWVGVGDAVSLYVWGCFLSGFPANFLAAARRPAPSPVA